jgi:phosphopantothenoylcysteine decarboxylase/phosphopantothenate--cysteine ligase
MKVLVGVSGGIAAYKAAELVRALQRQALDVRVVMTDSATRFIQPLTFSALTGHPVRTTLWQEGVPGDSGTGSGFGTGIEHISEALWADAFVIAPATANIIAKFAHGIADDLLSTLYLATRAPILIAPAMNVQMWEHPATQANIATLKERGVRFIEPAAGELACGMVGVGRLADPEEIANAVLSSLGRRHDLAGEVLLITAGGTREALDPVRFLGNRSSGKMGYALAEAAESRGARVILISGPSALYPPANCELLRVTTAEEMRTAVLARMNEATLIVKAAAVSDYRPLNVATEKLKRTGPLTIELAPTEDILAQVVERRRAGQLIIGFAAETHNELDNARAKLLKKGADAIVLNSVAREGAGFDADLNAATFLTRTTSSELPEMTKRKLADRILDEILLLRRPSQLLEELDASLNPTRAESSLAEINLEDSNAGRKLADNSETLIPRSKRAIIEE